ncbi:TetR/AcrR family transcriptional regulator [Plantactinospora sp. BB1]|uniref:TetR/AcrR family transcriptional regulator n=1 Tax=Plantactinospora sp. BB1 TaxID=2071627 RepID=UPI000D1726F4|nr:TetR/AcrR family transcriptional regulator [Plantactinospora sp. BB1]AVT39419.1 TetR family transcriptional regulator [Plantactinospora sp. BB1]
MAQSDGAVQARLVRAGLDLLAEEGVEALSLREIARRAGVSHGAPRRYFPTHRALLAAIAAEGYRELGRRVAEAVGDPAGPDPSARLLALGRLYLEFARTNRGMFELMFRHDLLRGNGIGLREASRPLFEVLVELVARARPERDGAPPPAVAAGALWANLHGIAQLWQWGSLQMTVGTGEVEPLLRAAIDAHLGPPVPAETAARRH